MDWLMIHDLKKEYFELDLASHRLSFDDGLFSQYYYYPLLSKNTGGELLYFIISSFVGSGEGREMFNGEYISPVKSEKYMHRALVENDFGPFMRLEEVQDLAHIKNVRLGVHSHFHDVIATRSQPVKKKRVSRWKLERIGCAESTLHPLYTIRSKLAFQGYTYLRGRLVRRSRKAWLDYIKYDTEEALQWFSTHLDQTPDTYCFPFNEHNQVLIDTLKSFGFRHFFSRRRIPPCPEIICRQDIDVLVDESKGHAKATSPSQ